MPRPVKCKVCGITFDREKEQAIAVDGRRYVHKKCFSEYKLPKDEDDLAKLHQYLKELFKEEYNYVVLQKQIEKYVKEFEFTYSGILKTLIYWYEIKQESKIEANGRIGIVPYIYQDAKNYYMALFLANRLNSDKNIEEYKNPEIMVVKIKPPVAEPIKKYRLFNLDD